MGLTDLIQEVITNTNRPELLAETKLAIRRATIKMHNLDYFTGDITEGKLSITPTIKPRIDMTQFGQRFRKFSAIYVMIDGKLSKAIPKIDPEVFNSSSATSGYYTLGGTLVIQNCGVVSGIIFQYYTAPVTTDDDYNSWIASKHPFAIIDEASRTVLASVGNLEKANFFAGLVGNKLPRPSGHIAEIISSNAIGYDSAE
jgi:hypothetical protein